MNAMAYGLGFRIVGSPVGGERRPVDAAAAFLGYADCDERAEVDREAYLSAFTFCADFREHVGRYGATRGFNGPCWAPWLWWDVDREGDLETARKDAACLAENACEHFNTGADDLLVFFSGSKGFHVGLPTVFWRPEPSVDFHRIARRFCETFASSVGVEIDTAIYDKLRAFRAPNSRHPKTGLHKRRLTLKELMHLKIEAITDLAKAPAPFDVPEPTGRRDCDWTATLDWKAATEAVRQEAEAVAERRANGDATLNRLTLDFIRDGAGNGERAKRLFSAAANLGEFGCPRELAHALLTESGLDSGLRPSEVLREIDCGLRHVGEVCHE